MPPRQEVDLPILPPAGPDSDSDNGSDIDSDSDSDTGPDPAIGRSCPGDAAACTDDSDPAAAAAAAARLLSESDWGFDSDPAAGAGGGGGIENLGRGGAGLRALGAWRWLTHPMGALRVLDLSRCVCAREVGVVVVWWW